jgi:hypothetical protein
VPVPVLVVNARLSMHEEIRVDPRAGALVLRRVPMPMPMPGLPLSSGAVDAPLFWLSSPSFASPALSRTPKPAAAR